MMEIKILELILNNYCRISGQRVNINKSSIIFEKGVSKGHKRITKTLGIGMVNTYLKYFGVNIIGKRL